jgi:hypothetical protein
MLSLLCSAVLKAQSRGAFAPGEIIRIGRWETHRPSVALRYWAALWILIWRMR